MEEKIGHYQIVGELGRGGMGVVYKAHEESLNRFVALKVLGEHLIENPEYLKRFLQEARSAAQLSHPNIVQIYFIGEDAGRHYFAMEFVSGKSLQDLIASEGKIGNPRAAKLVLQAASGLAAAHDEGVIHRDIKPANLMLSDSGVLKIADFGLAFLPDAATQITADDMLRGTPRYVSPEQCMGEDADGRSDIYSLGVSYYEMLSGIVPFVANSPLALIRQIVDSEPIPVRDVAPEVDTRTQQILARMMAKQREERYQDAHDLAGDLQGYLVAQAMPGWEVGSSGAGVASAAQVLAPVEPTRVASGDLDEQVKLGAGAQPPIPPTLLLEESPAPPQPDAGTAPPAPAVSGTWGRREVAFLVLVLALLALVTGTAVAWRSGLFERARTVAGGSVAADEPATEIESNLATVQSTESESAEDSEESSSRLGPIEATRTEGSTDQEPIPEKSPTENSANRDSPVAPPRGTVVVALGESLLAPEVEKYLEHRLAAAGLELVDEKGFPDIAWWSWQSESAPHPAELRDTLRGLAAHLVLAQIDYLGDRELEYLGRNDRAFQARVTVMAFDLATGQPLGSSWSENVEYTQLNVGDAASKALRRQTRELAQTLQH